jgi:hypothetical protein
MSLKGQIAFTFSSPSCNLLAMRNGNGATRKSQENRVEGVGFRRILVAAESTEAERAAEFAARLSGAFGATVDVLELPTARGLRQSGQDHQLAMAVADEAVRISADLIVLAADRVRVGRHHLAGSIRQQLSSRTHLPVMVAPSPDSAPSKVAALNSAPVERVGLVRRPRRFQHV